MLSKTTDVKRAGYLKTVESSSFASWKRSVLTRFPAAKMYGDKDIAAFFADSAKGLVFAEWGGGVRVK